VGQSKRVLSLREIYLSGRKTSTEDLVEKSIKDGYRIIHTEQWGDETYYELQKPHKCGKGVVVCHCSGHYICTGCGEDEKTWEFDPVACLKK